MANGVAPVAVTASTSSSTDADGTLVSSTINFGDGSAAVSGSNSTHTYSAAGTYVVTATVKDDKGAQSTALATITLKAAAVTITTPATSLTSVSPVHLVANALVPTGRTMSTMKVYVDNTAVFSTASTSFDKSFGMAGGKHTVVVKAWDNKGALYSDSVTITVMPKAGVNVTSPAVGATVATSAHFVATGTPAAGKTITGIKIYVDGAQKYATSAPALDTYLTLARGNHAIAIQTWDSGGATYKWSTTLTVK
jgi:large repetitive protein